MDLSVVYDITKMSVTEEALAEIRRCAKGGEECLEDADLRDGDKRWWREITKSIADGVEAKLNGSRNDAFMLYLGLMARDLNRIHVEGISRDRSVLNARSKLRAFGIAIAVALGCASVVQSSRVDDDNDD